MAMRFLKPTSAGQRFTTVSDFAEITAARPEKSLLAPLTKSGGRNNYGHITSYHRGGGHKRRYRLIDFKRDKFDIPGRVHAIEYDPNRSARVALVYYRDGEKRYIVAPVLLQVGDQVVDYQGEGEIAPGSSLKLKHIPMGSSIYNIEMKPGKGGQVARSAGTQAQLIAKEGTYAHVKMPSGEVRLILMECRAAIGQVGNLDHFNLNLGKAGRPRWQGRRPVTRGVAMNPVDHPHGGGEGKTSGGRHPVTPWGMPTKGYKTRNNKRTDQFILRRKKK